MDRLISSMCSGEPRPNLEKKKPLHLERPGAPTGIRTPVLALKGLRPSPLDDGGSEGHFTIHAGGYQWQFKGWNYFLRRFFTPR